MNKQEFIEQLDEALLHLYDYPYLESNSLVQGLLTPAELVSPARAIHRLITSAIEQLGPPADLPSMSPPWRTYRYLHLRYIQVKSVSQVSSELGISRRQSQRVHTEAMEALASVLWHRAADLAEKSNVASAVDRSSPEDDIGSEVSDLSRLATAAAGRSVNLTDLVSSIRSTIAGVAAASDLTIHFEALLDVPPIAIERTLLRQGLLSLLVAAIHNGAKRITVSGRTLPDAAEVTLVIARAPALLRRGETISGNRVRGALSTIETDRSLKEAVRLLSLQGGTVHVEQGRAGTATVRVTLPIVQPKTILVVDDNPDTISLFRRNLAGGNYRLVEATSGGRAIQLARRLHPAAIILDVMMPGQDGWETLQILHNDLETSHIPVLICSVINQRDLALSLGAVDLLPKPISRPALLSALARCLAESAPRSE